MANLISEFSDHNAQVLAFKNRMEKNLEQADSNFSACKALLSETKYNPALGITFARVLQCLNDEQNFSNYHLTDISYLYNSLIELQESNIDTYVEASHFEYAVMDNLAKAQEIVLKGLDMAKSKTEELIRLQKLIEDEIKLSGQNSI